MRLRNDGPLILATVTKVAIDSRPRVSLCSRLIWIIKGGSWEDRVFQSVANGDDTPTIGISFEVNEILAM
jgi:hypothetical protein